MTIALWFVKNWRTALTVLGALSAISFVTYFYLDYKALQKDNATLEENVDLLEDSLDTQKLATDAAVKRIKEFGAAIEEFKDDLQSLSEENAAISRRISDVRQSILDTDIDELVIQDSEVAGTFISSTINDLGGLFDCATTGSADCTAGITDSAGQDSVADSPSSSVE